VPNIALPPSLSASLPSPLSFATLGHSRKVSQASSQESDSDAVQLKEAALEVTTG